MRIRGAVLTEIGRPTPYAASRPITVTDLDLAEPGPGQVRLRITAAGLCHSDLSVVDGNRVRPVPMLLGHEATGVVDAVGPASAQGSVEPEFPLGSRVIVTFLPRCNECAGCATDGVRPCEVGSVANNAGTLLDGSRPLSLGGEPVHQHLGASGFATHAVVDTHSLVPVADDVPAEVAAVMGCAVLTGGGAVLNSLAPRAGQRLAVVGLGGVGMAAVLTALAHEGVEVLAIDPKQAKRDLAAEWGARSLHPDEAVEQGVRADGVIEAAGSARAMETAIALTAPGGTTCTVGLPHPDARISVSPLSLVAEARTIVGSYLGSAVPRRDIPRFVQMWREGRLPVERLISSTLELDDINAGMDALAAGDALRQVIRF